MATFQNKVVQAKRPWQFKLTSLLLMMGVVAAALGIGRSVYDQRRARKLAAGPWEKLGAEVTLSWDHAIIGLEFAPGNGSKVSDANLEEISKLPHLVKLDLGGYLGGRASISDAGIAHLNNSVQLRSLNLDGTEITAAGLADLKNLSQLQDLFLGSTGITGPDLVHLEGFSNLRGLWLNHTEIDDADLAHLKKHLKGMVHLHILHLAATNITDAGLVHLESMTQLRVLRVNGPGVSVEAMRALQEKLPRTEIWD